MPLKIEIPEQQTLLLEHLVLDFNGTLAVDGKLLQEVVPLLNQLSGLLEIHVLTADTFGTVKQQLENLPVTISLLKRQQQAEQKGRFVDLLGAERVVAIGNGNNDKLMLRKAALSIAVILKEGAAVATLQSAQLVCNNITDALNLLINPKRLIAGLR